MNFFRAIRQLFGWHGPQRPMDKPQSQSDFSTFDQTRSPADFYANEMDFRLSRRKDRYDVYDAMDDMADVSSVLDAYAEDASQIDHNTEKTVWIESDDNEIKQILNDFLQHTLDIEDWAEGCLRDTAKYGDDFAEVYADEERGVYSVFWMDPRDVERIENKEGILVGFERTEFIGAYVQNVTSELQAGRSGEAIKPTYEPWDMIHFRIFRRKRLRDEKCPNIYGTSLLAGSERIAKQVKILDDLLMIMRLTRSLDRDTYYVDVGRSQYDEEIKIIKRWKAALKRKQYIDPSSGRFDSKFDPMAWTEDTFWPVRENSTSKVERQSGMTNISDIVDIDHFRDKFFGSLRAPKAFFGYEGDVNAKATLSSQSIKWARAVYTLQRAFKNGIKRLCQIHLVYLGYEEKVDDFSVCMTLPSIIELLAKLESWQVVVDVADRMVDLGEKLGLDRKLWAEYVLNNVLWLSKQDVARFITTMPDEPQQPDADDQTSDDAQSTTQARRDAGSPNYSSDLPRLTPKNPADLSFRKSINPKDAVDAFSKPDGKLLSISDDKLKELDALILQEMLTVQNSETKPGNGHTSHALR